LAFGTRDLVRLQVAVLGDVLGRQAHADLIDQDGAQQFQPPSARPGTGLATSQPPRRAVGFAARPRRPAHLARFLLQAAQSRADRIPDMIDSLPPDPGCTRPSEWRQGPSSVWRAGRAVHARGAHRSSLNGFGAKQHNAPPSAHAARAPWRATERGRHRHGSEVRQRRSRRSPR
jgi:hypothetical protein